MTPLLQLKVINLVSKFQPTFEGKVKSVNIKVGDKVSEGDTILILEKNEVDRKKILKNRF